MLQIICCWFDVFGNQEGDSFSEREMMEEGTTIHRTVYWKNPIASQSHKLTFIFTLDRANWLTKWNLKVVYSFWNLERPKHQQFCRNPLWRWSRQSSIVACQGPTGFQCHMTRSPLISVPRLILSRCLRTARLSHRMWRKRDVSGLALSSTKMYLNKIRVGLRSNSQKKIKLPTQGN